MGKWNVRGLRGNIREACSTVAQGRLRLVTALGGVRIQFSFDRAGNRTREQGQVHQLHTDGSTTEESYDHWNRFDAMNRQTVVDGLDAQGDIGYVLDSQGNQVAQGHAVAYDLNGRRTSDTHWGTRVNTSQVFTGLDEAGEPVYATVYAGLVTESYGYDALDRLSSVTRDDLAAKALDRRAYDGAGRVLHTGTDAGIANQWFDAAGPSVASQSRTNRYDAAGNLREYRLASYQDDGFSNRYSYTLARFEGYKEGSVAGTSNTFDPGTTTDRYDANGFLIGINDSTKGENNRSPVNDQGGLVLQTTQQGQVERELIANGQLLGRYGVGVDETTPRDDDGNPRYASVAQFDPTFRPIDGNYPSAAAGSYTVQSGDTLQAIAQAAYGDSRLWWKIAQANGLAGNSDLKVGQTLILPSTVAGSHNADGDYRPYDPTKVVGDTTPNLPAPDGDSCGGLRRQHGTTIVYDSELAQRYGNHFDPTTNQIHLQGGASKHRRGLFYEEVQHAFDHHAGAYDASLTNKQLHAITARNLVENPLLPTTAEQNAALLELADEWGP
jgi:hypothetical protein